MEKNNIGDVCKDAYAGYGRECNNNRMIASIQDGLKTVYKRVLMVALKLPKNEFIKTATLEGRVLEYHPHSSSSISGVIAELVNMGIMEGKGNFGYSTMIQSFGAAASRYTHCRVSLPFRELVEPLMPYVRKSLGEVDLPEIDYIPTAFPICLLRSTTGLGIGCVSKYTSWTPKSLILATAKDDPLLLEPTNHLRVSDEDKRTFWSENKGSITYYFNLYAATSGGLQGWYIRGNPSVVKPQIGKLRKMQSDGRLVIRDESSGDDFKLFIGIPKRIQVDAAQVEELIKRACIVRTSFNLLCVYGGVTRPVTGKFWCEYVFKNYQRLVGIYKKDNLNKLDIDLEAYSNFKAIADLIINHQELSYSDIQKKLNLKYLQSVEKVASMSVGTLRNSDQSSKVKKVQDDINYFKELTYAKLVNNYIKAL